MPTTRTTPTFTRKTTTMEEERAMTTDRPITTAVEEFDWAHNGMKDQLLTCRNHNTGLWMTKNPSSRHLHFLREPIGMSWECSCPFSDLVVITDPIGVIGREFVWAREDDHVLRFRIDPDTVGGRYCEECAELDQWSRASVVGTCVTRESTAWYGYQTWLCVGCAQFLTATDEERAAAFDSAFMDN